MRAQQNRKNISEVIVKKFIDNVAQKTCNELSGYLDELRKLKEEAKFAPSGKKR